MKDIEELKTLVYEANKEFSSETNSKFHKAIKCQIRYYKLINCSSNIDYKLFHLSHQKKVLTTDQLVYNLSKILQLYQSENDQNQQIMQEPTSTSESKRERMDELKRKYTYVNKSPVKRKRQNPFPGQEIIE